MNLRWFPWIALALGCQEGPDDSGGPPNGGTGTEPTEDPQVEASGVITCPQPEARQAAPFTRAIVGQDWTFAEDFGTAAWDLRWGGRGVVVGDFDGDGHLDVVAPQGHEPSRLLLGRGDGAFDEAPLPDAEGVLGATGGAAADLEGDGDLDVFLYGQTSPAVMLVNQGDGTFVGVTHPEWDDADFPGCGGSASFADYDLDGDLDLFYGRLGLVRKDETGASTYYSCPSRLLRNDGTGGLVDASAEELGADLQELRIMASGWHQFDLDPWPELYVVADAVLEGVDDPNVPEKIGSNLLYDNGPEGLSRLEVPSLEIVAAGMGLGAADLNGDGLCDPMTPDVARLVVLQSTAQGLWIDQAAAWDLLPSDADDQLVAWGGDYADVDNDADLDLLVTYGAIPGGVRAQPDDIYLREGDVFVRGGEALGWADPDVTRGFVVADLNDDGWLDIVKRVLGGPLLVDVATCGAEAWMTVSLRGGGANAHAVGAAVTLVAGDRRFTATVQAGSTNFDVGGPPELHFGLGDLDVVDAIEVVWPDGTSTSHPGQDTRQHLVIHAVAPN